MVEEMLDVATMFTPFNDYDRLAASLFARFSSRGNNEYADRMLAALRNQFGGHAVKKG